YNSGSKAFDLSGYALSDKTENPMLWTFPKNTIINPDEYLIVFASGRESTTDEIHTNFSLSKNGETLIFSTPDGTEIQKVTFPTLGEDMTYGRISDGTMEIMQSTPDMENNDAVSAPVFSVSSGFYEKPFDLTLSSANKTEIYYTLDGSDPITSETAMLYKDAIKIKDCSDNPNIYSAYTENVTETSISAKTGYKAPTDLVDKAAVVCAVAKNSDGTFSKVSQQSYFITDGKLADYKDATVVSLITDPDNLFDPDKGIYVVGKNWNWGTGDVWAEDNDPKTMRNFHGRGKDWERGASITVFENGNTIVEQNMGIRIKGSSSRNAAQKSFNLFARSDYGSSKLNYPIFPDNTDYSGNLIEEYNSITLRASGINKMRDSFAQNLLKGRNTSTVQTKPCVLFINGEYWGLYEMAERLSSEYIEEHYGVSKKNITMIKDGQLEEGEQADCDSFFTESDSLSKLDMTVENNYRKACDFIDVDSFIEHYAAGLYLGVFDWPNYNYGVWRNTGEIIEGNPYSDGKWRFMSFDFDYSMGNTYDIALQNTEMYKYNKFSHMDMQKADSPTNLFISLLDNEEFRSKFIKLYNLYADSIMTESKVNELINSYREKYTDMVVDSELRWNESGFSDTDELKYTVIKNEFERIFLEDVSKYFANVADYTIHDMYEYTSISHSYANAPTYSISDMITLQKWLLGSGELENMAKYNLVYDENIDIYDMIMLRKKIAENISSRENMLADTNKWTIDTSGGASANIYSLASGFFADVKSGGSVPESIQAKYKNMT
ncbi:MAG: CotH kinase family protein, partial [Ruminococcus sp.]|nr:CotH kinase family protein [Ruminococcus sp.]